MAERQITLKPSGSPGSPFHRADWALIKPKAIAEQCSPRHIQSVLEHAQHDIAVLSEALRVMIPTGVCLTNRNVPDDVTVPIAGDFKYGTLRAVQLALDSVSGPATSLTYPLPPASPSPDAAGGAAGFVPAGGATFVTGTLAGALADQGRPE